jgi:hypothetical protein
VAVDAETAPAGAVPAGAVHTAAEDSIRAAVPVVASSYRSETCPPPPSLKDGTKPAGRGTSAAGTARGYTPSGAINVKACDPTPST